MPPLLASPYLLPVLLLIGSNVFMTLAWYGHLRFKEVNPPDRPGQSQTKLPT
jgi:uncharacterized protein (DUF486 family)